MLSEEQTRRGLKLLLINVFVDNLGSAFFSPFVSLYALGMGATRAQVGLLAAVPSLLCPPFQLLGASLVERYPTQKKWINIWACYVPWWFGLPGIILIPLFFQGNVAPYILILLITWQGIFSHIGSPAVTVLRVETIPQRILARFTSYLNIVANLVALVTTIFAGWLIRQLGFPTGYQVGAGLLAAISIGSIVTWILLPERSTTSTAAQRAPFGSPIRFLSLLRTDHNFLVLASATAFMSFGLNILGPQINVFFVQRLLIGADTIALLDAVATAAALLSMIYFGRFIDRGDPKRIAQLCAGLGSLSLLGWLFVTSPWHVVPIRLVASALWAGWELARFKFFISMVPEEQRGSYIAVLNTFNALPTFAGAALSGVIAETAGFSANFTLGPLITLLGALIFAFWVKKVATEESPLPGGEVGWRRRLAALWWRGGPGDR